jgi:hypothetical protein
MTFRSFLCVSGLVCAAAMSACGSDKPEMPMPQAGAAGTPDLQVDNPGGAGKAAAGTGGTSSAGTGGSAAGSGGSSGAAGAAGAAGTAAGSGGSTAGAGGSGGAGAGGAGGTGGAGGAGGSGGAGGAAGADSDDPFADIFGTDQISCDGLLCLEDSNCADFYPDEASTCKFTKCVDFVCQ